MLAKGSRKILRAQCTMPNIFAGHSSWQRAPKFVGQPRLNPRNIYLVGGIPTPLINMKVNEKDYPIYYGK
jgi:hypothetical protein